MPSKIRTTVFVPRRGIFKLLGAVVKVLRPTPGRKNEPVPLSDHLRRDVGLPPEAKPTLPEPPYPRI